jgi:nitroreductase
MEMETQALEMLIKSRRSIRKWKKDPVSEDVLKKAVELATWAPNGGNYQGWQFVAVTNKEVIQKIGDAVQSVVDRISTWPEAAQHREDVERYKKSASFYRNAPALIGVFIGQYQTFFDQILLKRESIDREAKEILEFRRSAPTSIQSASAAVTTMLLAFHQMGLGAIWLAGPLQAKREIEKMLKGPANMSLVCLVAAGYPDESPQKDRKPVDQVLTFIR